MTWTRSAANARPAGEVHSARISGMWVPVYLALVRTEGHAQVCKGSMFAAVLMDTKAQTARTTLMIVPPCPAQMAELAQMRWVHSTAHALLGSWGRHVKLLRLMNAPWDRTTVTLTRLAPILLLHLFVLATPASLGMVLNATQHWRFGLSTTALRETRVATTITARSTTAHQLFPVVTVMCCGARGPGIPRWPPLWRTPGSHSSLSPCG